MKVILAAALILILAFAITGCMPGDFGDDLVGGNVLPNESDSGSVGNSDYAWAEGHFDNLYLKGIALTTSGGLIVPLNWLGDLSSAPPTPAAGDAYYDTTHGKSVAWTGAAWQTLATDGAQGAAGVVGSVWHEGAGTPDGGLGVDGDYYLDTASGDVHHKVIGSWSSVGNIQGPAGSNGANGTNGTDGAPGPNTVTSSTTTDLTGYFFGNGSVVGASGYNIDLTNALATDQTWSGLTSTFAAGETLTLWNVVYLNSSSKLAKAKADSTSTMYGIALATGTIENDSPGTFLTYGYARDDSWSWTASANIFVSATTSGLLTQTAPTGTGKQVELVGVAITSHIILFNPNYMVLELK